MLDDIRVQYDRLYILFWNRSGSMIITPCTFYFANTVLDHNINCNKNALKIFNYTRVHDNILYCT